MNTFLGIGRLTKSPELRYTNSGTPVASFTIAIDRRVGEGREKETDFIDCVAWKKLAEVVANNLDKGRLVAVEGRLQIRSYETTDGQKRRAAEIVANNVQFLDRKTEGNAASKPALTAGVPAFDNIDLDNDDDIPF